LAINDGEYYRTARVYAYLCTFFIQSYLFLVEEDKFLRQISLEEQFGPIALKPNIEAPGEKDKRKKGAAIAFTYEDSTESPMPAKSQEEEEEDDDDDSGSEFDFGL